MIKNVVVLYNNCRLISIQIHSENKIRNLLFFFKVFCKKNGLFRKTESGFEKVFLKCNIRLKKNGAFYIS